MKGGADYGSSFVMERYYRDPNPGQITVFGKAIFVYSSIP